MVLNRFDINKDILRQKIGNFHEDYGVIFDEIKFGNISEVSKIYRLRKNWASLDFRQLNKDVLESLKLVNGKTFFANAKFFDKIPISAKSIKKKINSLMKKENISYKENGDIEFLVQFKKENDIMYRVLVRENKEKLERNDYGKFIVAIENPGSVIEISDFLRICWIFKIPLVIVSNNDKKFQILLNKAKKMTKGIPYEKLSLKIANQLPKDYVKIGFSIHASKDEKDLSGILNKEKIALIFGDEKFGLSQKARDDCDYLIKLTPEDRKPLRASHALSYVLGVYQEFKNRNL